MLKSLDLNTQRGLTDEQRPTGARDAASVSYGTKEVQLMEIHPAVLVPMCRIVMHLETNN